MITARQNHHASGRFASVDTPSEYRNTFTLDTATGTWHTVIMIFDNIDHAEAASIDHYDTCRVAADTWLFKHFGEHLDTKGEDIECSGYAPDNDDALDMRTVPTTASTVATVSTATTSYPIDC